MKKVAIVMGSDSDLPVLKKSVKILNKFDIPYVVRVISAHRTPAMAEEFAKNAEKENI